VKVGWLHWNNPEYFLWLERTSTSIAPFLSRTRGAAPMSKHRTFKPYCARACRTGDVVGCGYELATGKVFFTVNGAYQGVAFSDVPLAAFYPAVELRNSGARARVNFGQRPFVYREYAALGVFDADAGVLRAVPPPPGIPPTPRSSPLLSAQFRSPTASPTLRALSSPSMTTMTSPTRTPTRTPKLKAMLSSPVQMKATPRSISPPTTVASEYKRRIAEQRRARTARDE
jgi:hypothetical protein